ncbi:hypothetical protein Clacol_003566 [Clathrus columnatus]|uniref:NmrA-like domain-containing protein n=1 Tax=Clathrus columnatus TaxID=1419009 RepID=A0AAV5A3X4_9AGAM|nr:hypothetical protein Clacol_003566 [Clathrus columnatus]
MSLPMSAYLSRGQYVVAIAGSTGKIGYLISKVFLSPSYRPFYSEVRLFVRDTGSLKAKELAQLGGTLVKVDMHDHEALNKALKGVDVVINALGGPDHEAKSKLLDGVLASNAILYIPSEYGVDHRFNGFEHILWTDKQKHVSRARSEGVNLKVIAIYVGFFLETAFSPAYGVDKENKRYNIIGSKDTRTTYTAMEDIARAVVQITTMALNSPSSIPDDIRIAGTTVSWEEINRFMHRESGEEMQIVSLDEPQSFREKTIQKEGTNGNARELLMSEGKIDFSVDNQNELINPGEKLWDWTTMEQYAKNV